MEAIKNGFNISARHIIKTFIISYIIFLVASWGVSLVIQSSEHGIKEPPSEQARQVRPEQPNKQAITLNKSIQLTHEANRDSRKSVSKTTVPKPVDVTMVPKGNERSTKMGALKAPEDNNRPTSASDKAAAYLRQVIGDESNEYKQVHSLSDEKQQKFVFTRMIKGISLLEDYYVVNLEEKNNRKSIISRNQRRVLDEQLFPDPAKAISKEEAEAIIASKMTFVYTSQGDSAAMAELHCKRMAELHCKRKKKEVR